MRALIILPFFLFVCHLSFSSVITFIRPTPNAKQILIPIGKTGSTISLYELSRISRTDLEEKTGKKMKVIERLAFKRAQKKLSKGISSDGTITGKKLKKFFSPKKADGETGFHVVGFILGFLLGLIGVLLAYVINDDADKSNRVKWAWIGLLVNILLVIGLYILVFSATVI